MTSVPAGIFGALRLLSILGGLGILGYLGYPYLHARLVEPSLPSLPEPQLDDVLPVVRQQLERAHQDVSRRPARAAANGKVGMIYHAYLEYQKAAIFYERAVRLAPRDFRWPYLLSVTQSNLGLQDAAVSSLERAIALSPDYLPARIRLADMMLAAGNLARSRELYSAVVAANDSLAIAYYGYGNTLALLGHHESARAQLQRALELSPDYGAAHYTLAMVLRSLGEKNKAEQHLLLHELNSGSEPPRADPLLALVSSHDAGVYKRMQRAHASGNAGAYADAVAMYEQIIEMDPTNAVANANLILGYAALERLDDARKSYRRAVELIPNWAEAHYLYGRVLSERGQCRDALEPLRKTIVADPNYADALTQLGLCFEQLGQYSEAIMQYRKALASEPGHRPSHLFLALRFLAEGKQSEAQRHLDVALAAGDTHVPIFHQRLARFYVSRGDLDSGKTHLLAAIDIATAAGDDRLVDELYRNLAQVRRAPGSQ